MSLLSAQCGSLQHVRGVLAPLSRATQAQRHDVASIFLGLKVGSEKDGQIPATATGRRLVGLWIDTRASKHLVVAQLSLRHDTYEAVRGVSGNDGSGRVCAVPARAVGVLNVLVVERAFLGRLPIERIRDCEGGCE